MPSTIYIATTAATISQTVLPSADWKARVLPWKLRGDIHRQIQRLFGVHNRLHRIAQRIVIRHVKGDGRYRELIQMVDGKRRKTLFNLAIELNGTTPPSLLVRRMVSSAARPGVISVLCSSTTRYWLA